MPSLVCSAAAVTATAALEEAHHQCCPAAVVAGKNLYRGAAVTHVGTCGLIRPVQAKGILFQLDFLQCNCVLFGMVVVSKGDKGDLSVRKRFPPGYRSAALG